MQFQLDEHGEIVRDEAFMRWLREDPVYVGLMNVHRMAAERHIAEVTERIEVESSRGRNMDRDRRYLARLLGQKAKYDEEIGSAA